MIINRIVDKRKSQHGFLKCRKTENKILAQRRINEGIKAKELPAVLISVDFRKALDTIHRVKIVIS